MDFKDIKNLNHKNAFSINKQKKKILSLNYISSILFSKYNPYQNLKLKPMNTFFRFVSGFLDSSIVLLIRIVCLMICTKLYISDISIAVIEKYIGLNFASKDFATKINSNFFTQYIIGLQALGYFTNVILLLLLCFVVGSLYHIFMPLRYCKTTFAGQLLKFVIVKKKDLTKITIWQAIFRYFLSLMPLFLSPVFSYLLFNTLYYKYLIISGVICYMLWFDLSSQFVFKGQSLSDKFSGTIMLRKTWG